MAPKRLQTVRDARAMENLTPTCVGAQCPHEKNASEQITRRELSQETFEPEGKFKMCGIALTILFNFALQKKNDERF